MRTSETTNRKQAAAQMAKKVLIIALGAAILFPVQEAEDHA